LTSGFYPKDDRLERYIKAIGIIKSLDVRHEYLPSHEENELKIFKRHSLKSAEMINPGSPTYKERTIAKFVNHINNCLDANEMELTPEGKHNLSRYTGEVLDNAIQHSEMNEWEITGFLDNSIEPHLCEIAIFNFGRTIYESFNKLDRNSYPFVVQLNQFLKSASFSNMFTEETCITLLALQETISSKNESKTDTRGSGTVQLIEFFQDIHRECTESGSSSAKMAMLSGKTHILFDGTYKMINDDHGRATIAFNKSNNLKKKPNPKYVRTLGDLYFPGTILSIQFPMQKTYTKEVDHGTKKR
jgi:hypothetical protein